MGFREARRGDLERLVDLLASDPLGQLREDAGRSTTSRYEAAFETLDADPHHLLLVAVVDDRVIAMLQLSYLPHLTYQGGWRAQIEGVRVDASERGAGVGRALVEEAIRRAEARGCHLVQLTTDKRRPEALRFYEGLGFVASHVGLKKHFDRGSSP